MSKILVVRNRQRARPVNTKLLRDIVGTLLVEVLLQQPATTFSSAPPPNVISALIERFVHDVPSSAARGALEACAIVRVLTEPLLAALLGKPDVHAEFTWLRGLSFIGSFVKASAMASMEATPEALSTAPL